MTRARELSRLIRSDTVTETSEIVLTAVDTDEPQANVFIRFRDADDATKGVMGFTATGDDTMSMTSYRDARMKFRTGNAAETAFVDRVHMYGTDDTSYLSIVSANSTDLGGCFIRFVENDSTTTKGFVGYASTTDDDLDVINSETDAHVSVTTTGTGAFKVNPVAQMANGSASAPGITFLGDVDTGVFREAANVLGLAAGGAAKLAVSASGIHVGTSSAPFFSSGSGSPEAAVSAPIGSLFLRTDGSTSTTLYVKTSGSGNTGWTAK